MSRIYRYEVPVDDGWHPIRSAPPLHVDCRTPSIVEFWAHPLENDETPLRAFRVYGTGHEIPDRGVCYSGTALAPGGGLVWHLMSKWVAA